MSSTRNDLIQQCAEAVDQVVTRHDWTLIERERFVQRTVEYVQAGVASDPNRAAIHAYCHALYRACSGSDGSDRQERAYRELFRYLYDVASRRYADVSADATQLACERIFANFDRCRQPGTFLAFAFQHLRDAARSVRRRQDREAVSLETPVGAGDDVLGMLLPDPNQPPPSDEVLMREQREELHGMIDRFMDRHPRAHQQLAALLLKYISGLDDESISRRLDTSVSNVYVLRSRAKKKLQRDPDWRSWAADFGISLDDSV